MPCGQSRHIDPPMYILYSTGNFQFPQAQLIIQKACLNSVRDRSAVAMVPTVILSDAPLMRQANKTRHLVTSYNKMDRTVLFSQ